MNKKLEEKLLIASRKSLENPGKSLEPMPKFKKEGFSNLFVFRHAQSTDNVERIFSGKRNPGLTQKGLEQARALARKMEFLTINIGITSNLIRCKETLEIVLKNHPNSKFEVSDFLSERDYGDLTGKNKIEMAKRDPLLVAKYRRSYDFPPPNGESLKMVWENRIKRFCVEIEEKISKTKLNIAVCGSNNSVRLIRMYFEKLSIETMLTLENPTGQDYAQYAIK